MEKRLDGPEEEDGGELVASIIEALTPGGSRICSRNHASSVPWADVLRRGFDKVFPPLEISLQLSR